MGRPCVIVEVRIPRGDAPADAARQWGAVVLESGMDSATLLLLPAVEEVDHLLELLRLDGAVDVEVLEPGAVLAGTSRVTAQHDVEVCGAVDA